MTPVRARRYGRAVAADGRRRWRPGCALAQKAERRRAGDSIGRETVLDLEPLDRRLRPGAEETVHRPRPVAQAQQLPLEVADPLRPARPAETGAHSQGRDHRRRGGSVGAVRLLDRAAVPACRHGRLRSHACGRERERHGDRER
jgi:hypothetical protein